MSPGQEIGYEQLGQSGDRSTSRRRGPLDGVDDESGSDSRIGILACEVDVGDDDAVGGGQRLTHLGTVQPRAAHQVRLIGDDQAVAGGDGTRGGEVSG